MYTIRQCGPRIRSVTGRVPVIVVSGRQRGVSATNSDTVEPLARCRPAPGLVRITVPGSDARRRDWDDGRVQPQARERGMGGRAAGIADDWDLDRRGAAAHREVDLRADGDPLARAGLLGDHRALGGRGVAGAEDRVEMARAGAGGSPAQAGQPGHARVPVTEQHRGHDHPGQQQHDGEERGDRPPAGRRVDVTARGQPGRGQARLVGGPSGRQRASTRGWRRRLEEGRRRGGIERAAGRGPRSRRAA